MSRLLQLQSHVKFITKSKKAIYAYSERVSTSTAYFCKKCAIGQFSALQEQGRCMSFSSVQVKEALSTSGRKIRRSKMKIGAAHKELSNVLTAHVSNIRHRQQKKMNSKVNSEKPLLYTFQSSSNSIFLPDLMDKAMSKSIENSQSLEDVYSRDNEYVNQLNDLSVSQNAQNTTVEHLNNNVGHYENNIKGSNAVDSEEIVGPQSELDFKMYGARAASNPSTTRMDTKHYATFASVNVTPANINPVLLTLPNPKPEFDQMADPKWSFDLKSFSYKFSTGVSAVDNTHIHQLFENTISENDCNKILELNDQLDALPSQELYDYFDIENSTKATSLRLDEEKYSEFNHPIDVAMWNSDLTKLKTNLKEFDVFSIPPDNVKYCDHFVMETEFPHLQQIPEALTITDLEKIGENEKIKRISGMISMKRGKLSKIAKIEEAETDGRRALHLHNQDRRAMMMAATLSGLDKYAFKVLKQFGNNPSFHRHKLLVFTDVKAFNVVIHSLAKTGKNDLIKEVLSIMKDNEVVANYQTYAGILECLGRRQDTTPSDVDAVLQKIVEAGLDVQDLFNNCTFKTDERSWTLKAILLAVPNYQPNKILEPKLYKGVLFEKLNTKLSAVVEKNPYGGLHSNEELHRRCDQQLEREIQTTLSIPSCRQKSGSENNLYARDKLAETKVEWRKSFLTAFKTLLESFRNAKKRPRHDIYPFLAVLTPEEYADVVIRELDDLCSLSESFSPTINLLQRMIGLQVYNRYRIKEKIKTGVVEKTSKLYKKYLEEYNREDFPYLNHRHCWHKIINENIDGPTMVVPDDMWNYYIIKTIGMMLYDIILQEFKIDVNILNNLPKKKYVPAFYTIFRSYNVKTCEEIKISSVLTKLYSETEEDALVFDAKYLPMLVPPLPWLSADHGGPLLSSQKLIRSPDQCMDQYNKLEEIGPDAINGIMDSLNILSACAWKINKPILNMLTEVFNNKGNPDLNIPVPLSELPDLIKFPKNYSELSSREKMLFYRQKEVARQHRSENYSLWCTEHYRLSIANAFKDEVFWFPHNLDFRGRTYPISPYFNHLGNDLSRSLLIFAKGKPLGKEGLKWLKIHLVNLTGLKKRSSNDERLQFADDMIKEIKDSADNPFTGNKWWQTCDEPWQTLACCKEITNAVRSPDPSKYICHLPCHQDGSCNGLQHYAALGRDKLGAESVNLTSNSSPQDVYSDVVLKVERIRQNDAMAGVKTAQLLEGYVNRKVIKQTVMTTVYGVTRYGAKLQILKQLQAISEFPKAEANYAAVYLAEKTFQAIEEMFTSSKAIQDWLRNCAEIIGLSTGKPVEWVTPLGLPVVQPYHVPKKYSVNGVVSKVYYDQFQKPNVRKQKNAFPPNFIHSLDSSHMMLTSLFCHQAGITYVSVHDCFWTHANDVPVMNQITREQFVALHSQPILNDLCQYLLDKFEVDRRKEEKDIQTMVKHVISNVPDTGEYDLNQVLDSTYFFS